MGHLWGGLLWELENTTKMHFRYDLRLHSNDIESEKCGWCQASEGQEKQRFLLLSVDAVQVSVGGAIFFVCSATAISASADDTALLILF